MLNNLSYNQKKLLVDNKELITNLVTGVVTSLVTGAIGSLCTIAFNIHDYEFKRVVRNEPDEDFIVFEELSTAHDKRDLLRGVKNARKQERKELDQMCRAPKKEEKKGGKKNGK